MLTEERIADLLADCRADCPTGMPTKSWPNVYATVPTDDIRELIRVHEWAVKVRATLYANPVGFDGLTTERLMKECP